MKEMIRNDWKLFLLLGFLLSTVVLGLILIKFQIHKIMYLQQKYKHQNEATSRRSTYFHEDGTRVYIMYDVVFYRTTTIRNSIAMFLCLVWMILVAILTK